MHTHPPDPAILAHCVALVVANNQPDTEALMRLAEKLRVGDIAAWSPTLGHAPFSHRLVFFLVHFDFGDADPFWRRDAQATVINHEADGTSLRTQQPVRQAMLSKAQLALAGQGWRTTGNGAADI